MAVAAAVESVDRRWAGGWGAAGGGRARPASRAPRKHWEGATSRERLPGSCICVHAKPCSVFITAAGSRVPRLHGKQETMLHLEAAASA